jgi:hypothetical protein
MKRVFRRSTAWGALAGSLLALAGCGGGGGGGGTATPPPVSTAPPVTPTPTPPATVASAVATGSGQSLVTLSSDAGDSIGQGASYAYDTTNSVLRLTPRGANLGVQVTGRESWSANFQLPGALSQLQPGTYSNLTRYPFQAVGAGGLSWSGEGRGCNVLTGTFTIHSVSYVAGVLQAIDLSFEQHCEGAVAALKGRIRVDAATMAGVMAPQNGLPGQPVVALASEPGDYIGVGGAYAYDRSTAAITLKADGGLLNLRVVGDESWTGSFKMPGNATALAAGTYAQLTRYPFQAAGTGALDWSGEGRGCNMLTGTVTINSVRYDTAGELAAIDLDFEQHCEGTVPALRGHIAWDASQPVSPPGPLAIAPAGLWAPPAGDMPATGNAMYVASDWGDYIGAGYIYKVGGAVPADLPPANPGDTRGTVAVSLTETNGMLKLGLTGAVTWDAEFKAMDGLPHLQPGYYGIVQRYPFHNPRRGGMSVSMDHRGCNKLSGWFMIDKITYQGDKIASVDLRFAQYCEGNIAALRGQVRWSLGSSTQ